MQIALPQPGPVDAPPVPPSAKLAHDLALLLVALLALAAWDASGLDLVVSRRFADASGFALRDDWFLAEVMHANAKWLAIAAGVLLLVNIWRPLPFARAISRPMRVWWLATTLACLALIPIMKALSSTSCPWSLIEFGGPAHYVSHWAFGVADGGPGRCFPAGHASAAFSFLPGYFALRDSARVAARRWLIAAIAFGVVLGAVQLVRGAHYVSHSLWTGWWCWALTVASFHACRRWLAARREPARP